jgi:hypothetical protein
MQQLIAVLDGFFEVAEWSVVCSDAMVKERVVCLIQHLRTNKGIEQHCSPVANQRRFKSATAQQRKDRLTLPWSRRVLASRDSTHFHVVYCRDDIGMALGVTSPLLEPPARLASCPLSLVRHSWCGLSIRLLRHQF